MSLRLFATLLLALLCHAAPGFAQTGQVSSVVREAFAVRAFDDIDLPQASVRAVHVCEQGYLWAGTREGLVQYKSGQQRTWSQTTDGSTGLPSGMVNTIYEDSRGTIWVGTGRGIGIKGAYEEDFRVLIQSDESRAEQLNIVDFEPLEDRLLAISTSGEVLSVSQDDVKILSQRSNFVGAEHDDLQALRPTSAVIVDGDLLVGTTENSIYRLRIDDLHFDIIDVTSTQSAVVDLQRTDSELIWLERHTGLAWKSLTQDAEVQRTNPFAGKAQGYFRAFAASSSRSAWFGGGPNIVRLRGEKADLVRLPGRGNEVRSITRDSAGNVWIGTYYGLFYGLDTEFNTLQTAATYESGVISSLAATEEQLFIGGQNLWAGALDGENFVELRALYDPQAIEALRLDPMNVGQDPVTALSTANDFLLVGYFVGGLDVVDLRTGRVTQIMENSNTGDDLENVGVSSFIQVDENRWLVTLFLYGLAELTVNRQDNDSPSVSLRRISNNNSLIGIYRISTTRFLAIDQGQISIVDALPDNSYRLTPFELAPPGIVFDVEADGSGGAFLGIENTGVRHLSAAMIAAGKLLPTTVPVIERYLAGRTIWHLLMEDGDILWITTNNGIYVFDLPKEELISHITYRDGLPSNEFEFGASASLHAPNGEKVFISNQGPVTFQAPARTLEEAISLRWNDARIDDVRVDQALETNINGSLKLTLPFSAVSDSVLRLEYRYYDHVKALDATYATRFSRTGDWIPGGLPSVSLTGFQRWDPIHLEIAMLNSSGAVISDPLSIDLTLIPPPYMLSVVDLRVAIPVLCLVALLLMGSQLSARRRQQKALAQAAQQREIIEAEMRGRLSEKEILLREIHHRVGNILSNFSANVSGMRRNARSDETRSALGQLGARIKVQSAVHSLLQRSDSTDINVANMIRQVVSGAKDLMGNDDDKSVSLALDDVYMTYSKAQYVGLITNELLTNTYKHGRNRSKPAVASLSMRQDKDGTVLYSYRDFGMGISPDEVTRALTTKPREAKGGLAQVIAMITELKAQPLLENDQGLHLSFRLPSRLISRRNTGRPDQFETSLAD